MKRDHDPVYSPMRRKSFESSLQHLLYTEYRFLGGRRVINMIVRDVRRLVEQFYPANLSVGQIVWPAIKKDEKGQRKRIEELQIIPVVLNLVTKEDIRRLEHGTSAKEVWRGRAARLFEEAYEQGGVLTDADVGMLLSRSERSISTYVTEYQKEHNTVIPTRGNIHDMGRGTTHKAVIVGKKLNNKSTSQIARETRHSPEAVDRYIKDYYRVKMLIGKQFDREGIARATGISKRVVEEYENLIQDKEDKESL